MARAVRAWCSRTASGCATTPTERVSAATTPLKSGAYPGTSSATSGGSITYATVAAPKTAGLAGRTTQTKRGWPTVRRHQPPSRSGAPAVPPVVSGARAVAASASRASAAWTRQGSTVGAGSHSASIPAASAPPASPAPVA